MVPLIVIEDVPLTDAIRNLARQSNLNFQFDPRLTGGTDGKATNQPIICSCAGQGGGNQGLLFVYTAYIGAHDRGDYGSFTLKKVDGQWKILQGGTDLDPIFACMLCSEDR